MKMAERTPMVSGDVTVTCCGSDHNPISEVRAIATSRITHPLYWY